MARYAAVVALLIAVLAPVYSLSAQPQAQMAASCGRELARQDAALRQFDADAKKEALDFALNDAREAALSGMRKSLEGDATADALKEWQQKYEDWRQFIERGKTMETMMGELSRCLTAGGRGGCVNEIMAKAKDSTRLLGIANDQFSNWIKSLGNDTISKAAERVERARSVMQNLGKGAGNMAIDAATGALKSCYDDMERRVQARQQTMAARAPQLSEPPQPTTSPRPPAPGSGVVTSAPAAGGGHAGRIAGAAVAAAGGGIGLYVANEYAKTHKCGTFAAEAQTKVDGIVSAVNSLSACGSNVGCLTSRQPAVNGAASSLSNTVASWCACLGPQGVQDLSTEDRAAVNQSISYLRQAGFATSSLDACFR
jgi:hypothetical protein